MGQIVGIEINPIESTERVNPLCVEDLSQQCKDILSKIPGEGLKGKGFPANVLGEIMHNPNTIELFLDYWVSSKSQMLLSIREQEIVILRVAYLYSSDYVWKHHVSVGTEFGISKDELRLICCDEVTDAFDSHRELALLHFTEELVNKRTIRFKVWHQYKQYLSDQEVVDLISLVSQYVFFALMNNALQVQVESALDSQLSLRDM